MGTKLSLVAEAKRLERKLARIASMNSSYKFRLGAILATDNRPGKVWPTAKRA